jgi:hypothetical protein
MAGILACIDLLRFENFEGICVEEFQATATARLKGAIKRRKG